jgi:hypothetical protein
LTVEVEIEALARGSLSDKRVGNDLKVLWLGGLTEEQVVERLGLWLADMDNHNFTEQTVSDPKAFFRLLYTKGEIDDTIDRYYFVGWVCIEGTPSATEIRAFVMEDIASGNKGDVGVYEIDNDD